MKNVGIMNLRMYMLYILGFLLFVSCETEKRSKEKGDRENNENVIFVDANKQDSLYRLYDSVSKLWHKSRKELSRLDRLANTKAAYSDDFYFEYESNMQYVFELSKELNGLDSICSTVGIFTFNYKIYKTSEKAIESIDSVLNDHSLNLSEKQKQDIYKDRKRLIAVKNKVYKRKY